MGRRRRDFGRDITGVLLLDKPQGMTSNAALQEVKKIFFAKKAGHTGSLDPLATGLLPICFGEATKFSHYLLHSDKKYTVTCKLGVTTNSGDADGEVIATQAVTGVTKAKVSAVLPEFLGETQQIPPMHSAIKVDGEPLYKKAHRGETIERESRAITVFAFDFVSLEGDELVLNVHCSKGTYVRVLVEDLGNKLGCGAHVSALRRTELSDFVGDEMVTLADLESYRALDDKFVTLNKQLLAVGEMTRAFPSVELDRDAHYYISQGQAMRINNSPKSGMVSLYHEEKFVGVGIVLEDGRIEPKRLMKSAK